MLALGHERFVADGATFVRDRDLPDIWEADHATAVTAATGEAVERLLASVEREYAGFGHRRFDLDFTTPPVFEARLLLDGYPGVTTFHETHWKVVGIEDRRPVAPG
jgi:hypothetical protein